MASLLLEGGDLLLLEGGGELLLEAEDFGALPETFPDCVCIIGAADDDYVDIVGSSYSSDGDVVDIETLNVGIFRVAFLGNSRDRRRIVGYRETERRRVKLNG